jgi:hypothetical protein
MLARLQVPFMCVKELSRAIELRPARARPLSMAVWAKLGRTKAEAGVSVTAARPRYVLRSIVSTRVNEKSGWGCSFAEACRVSVRVSGQRDRHCLYMYGLMVSRHPQRFE